MKTLLFLIIVWQMWSQMAIIQGPLKRKSCLLPVAAMKEVAEVNNGVFKINKTRDIKYISQ